uniref:Uncharacterized protein n=1 Tax=Rangifer tarandus platyrhynchus TaxID=3082113 RepID=A0ACB0ETZ4_RANTA|nr:unnamed protein product [Rangifer tarandus platyrhynchus]
MQLWLLPLVVVPGLLQLTLSTKNRYPMSKDKGEAPVWLVEESTAGGNNCGRKARGTEELGLAEICSGRGNSKHQEFWGEVCLLTEGLRSICKFGRTTSSSRSPSARE